jgi:nucleotide-binding universal stress UspA family protein
MKILVAHDGSESAYRALERAVTLAEHGASVSVVTVGQPHKLALAKAILAVNGIEARTVERKGDPASMILDQAEKENADVIVTGTRGRNAVQRWLRGSVSSRVLSHAPCDVVVVR